MTVIRGGMTVHGEAEPQDGDQFVYCGCATSKLAHAWPAPPATMINPPPDEYGRVDESKATPAKWVLACHTHAKIALNKPWSVKPRAAGTWTTT